MNILYVNFNVVLLLFSKPLGTVLVWIRICLDQADPDPAAIFNADPDPKHC